MDNKVPETITDVYCPTCRNQKCVYVSTNNPSNFHDCKKGKACCHVLNITLEDQKPTMMLFGDDGTHGFVEKMNSDYENEKSSIFLKKCIRQSQSTTPEPEPKRQKSFHFWHNLVDFPLADTLNQKFISSLILYIFSLK